ncbi:MAG: zinc metalloprotease HtpX [Candidatus Abyssubacteria bacterium]
MNGLPEWLTANRILIGFLVLFLFIPLLVLLMPLSNNLYEQMSGNRRKSVALCAFFILLIFILALVFEEVAPGTREIMLPLAFAFAAIGPLISYYNSDKIILRMSRAREVSDNEPLHVYLKNTVEGLALAAGIPPPKLYIIDDTAPNAFATGRNPEHAAIAVTTGLLQKLNRRELEGVLAHEMSHIKNYDILLGSIAVILVGVVALLSDWLLRSFRYSTGRSRRSRSRGGGQAQAIIVIIAILLAILAPIVAQLLRLAISRKREFLADANGAFLTRYPEGLASALKKLDADTEPLEAANKSTAHLYIVNPLREHASFLNNLFSTHPPTEERIAALEKM